MSKRHIVIEEKYLHTILILTNESRFFRVPLNDVVFNIIEEKPWVGFMSLFVLSIV